MTTSTDKPLRLVTDTGELLRCFGQIKDLADSESKSLGFIPEKGLSTAILRGKMMALTAPGENGPVLAGYIFHSGVFPHAKIQQVATAKDYRQNGVASALVSRLVSDLAKARFVTIRADVATDLPAALAFYGKNGFVHFNTRSGGKARNRLIAEHIRELEADTLFSLTEQRSIALGSKLGPSKSWETQSFALDLNVLLDLAKKRAGFDESRRIFSSALNHEIHVVVADEFVKELIRNSAGRGDDPVLQVAQAIPRLPGVPESDLKSLMDEIHDLVFIQSGSPDARNPQSWSDAGHLAHVVLSEVSAFVTRDKTILASGDKLIEQYGIDILTPQELTDLLPDEPNMGFRATRQGSGFDCKDAEPSDIAQYLREQDIDSNLLDEFTALDSPSAHLIRKAVLRGNEVVACGVMIRPRRTQPVCRMLVHVRPEDLNAEMFADFLVNAMIQGMSSEAPSVVEVECVRGQAILSSVLRSRYFTRSSVSGPYWKVVLKKPVTPLHWDSTMQEIWRKTNLVLPKTMPSENEEFTVEDGKGGVVSTNLLGLEELIGPAMVFWPNRQGVIAPITKVYSEQLLSIPAMQGSLFNDVEKDASFLSRRSYINSPLSAGRMKPRSPIFFYESKGRGGRSGRGAVVACARITDVVLMRKKDIPRETLRRIVVEDIESHSHREDILVSTFDSLFAFPHPVELDALREIGAVSGANLVTAERVSGKKMIKIVEQGWQK